MEKSKGLGKLSDYEKQLVDKMLPELKGSIKKGEEWANAELAK